MGIAAKIGGLTLIAITVATCQAIIEPDRDSVSVPAAPPDPAWVHDVVAVRQLRASMNDPGSFTLEKATRTAARTLCLTYRARNGFNALVLGQAVVANGEVVRSGSDNVFASAWGKHCAGKSGPDMTHIRSALWRALSCRDRQACVTTTLE